MSKELHKLAEPISKPGSRLSEREETPLHPVFQLQRLAGNRAVMHLLGSDDGDDVPQHSLTLTPSSGGIVQRKCKTCTGTSKCAACEDEERLQRKQKNASILSSTSPHIQRAPNNGGPSATPEDTAATGPLIVADDASTVAPGQMRKTEFLEQLRTNTSTTGDAALERTGRSPGVGPQIQPWFDYLAGMEASQIEQSLRRYAPETAGATNARDLIPAVSNRVRDAVDTWARTGEITGIPPEMAGLLSAAGMGGITGAIAGALSGIVTGIGSAFSSIGRALFKRKVDHVEATDDPSEIQTKLSDGQSLDSGAASRLGAAFGRDFSNVRVHTDAKAAALSNNLNARAFTVGGDIAFGPGEYQPGTLIGDALIAHELAHVVQQESGSAVASSKNSEPQNTALEDEADESAVGAMLATWGDKIEGLRNIGTNSMPRLKSGLKLQRCGGTVQHHARVPGGGAVEMRTGESCVGLDNPIAMSYVGPNTARSHWVQFYWTHVAVPLAGGGSTALQCPRGRQRCTFPVQSGYDAYLTTDSSNPIWMIDINSRATDPYYQPSTATLTDPQGGAALFVRDRPGIENGRPIGDEVVRQFPNAQSAEFVQHFETYLIRNNVAVYRMNWLTVTRLTRSGNSMDISGRDYQGIGGTAVSGLPANLREVLVVMFPRFANIR